MSHLGRWLSAQVDGELDGVERDKVLNHIAGCDACREEANALRALKRRMTALGDTGAADSITGRLIELARSDKELAEAPARWTWPVRPSWTATVSAAGFAVRQPWLTWRVATSSAGSALLAIGVIAFMLGGSSQDRPTPRVTPAVDAYWTEHIFDTGQDPATPSSSVAQGPQASGALGPAGPYLQPDPQSSTGLAGLDGPASAANTPASGRPPAGGGPANTKVLIRLDVP